MPTKSAVESSTPTLFQYAISLIDTSTNYDTIKLIFLIWKSYLGVIANKKRCFT